MVVVTTAEAVIAGGQPVAAPWVYLGKSLRVRRRVAARLGSARLSLGSRVHHASAALRQPFLDFIADVGRQQADPVLWWSTTFSWKVWGASDFFLLLCYLRVARDLIDEAAAGGAGLTIVIEDPWLVAQLGRGADPAAVQVTPRPVLAWLKLTAAGFGLARRAAWLIQTLTGWIRQRRAWPASEPIATPRATAAIYTYPMDRCLRDAGGWADALLPGFDDILKRTGHEAIYFSTPERVGFEQAIGERARFFRPLILFASAGAVVRSLVAFWPPHRGGFAEIAGMDVNDLARREWWTDLSRAAWCRNRMFFECARRMLRVGRFEWLVFPYESQPWEKLLVLAARERDVKCAGIQHSTLGANYLSFFLGRDEAQHAPLPDVVLTSGKSAHAALTDGGYPPGRVVMTGSVRYQHLSVGHQSAAPAAAPAAHVLVGLPIDRPMAEHLLAALGAAFPDGGRADGLQFFVKCHPMTAIDPVQCGLSAEVISGTFEQALEACGTVVFTGSTTGPEAAARGRAVLRYRPELLIDVDVSGAVSATMPVCSDDDLREQLLRLVADRQPRAVPGPDLLESLFAAVDWDALYRVFQRSVAVSPLPAISPRSS